MELVEKGNLFELFKDNQYFRTRTVATIAAKNVIDSAPTIDAEPVRHGHWEYVDTHLLQTYHRCSECGNVTGDYIINKQTFQHDKLYYCPYCGAKMDEVKE